MSAQIELISDGEGLAVIGDAHAVERFLADEGLDSKPLALSRLGKVMGAGAVGLQAASEIAENSGRWVKLTSKSAKSVRNFGLMETGKPGSDISHAMIGQRGHIKEWLQIEKAPGAIAANPAMLAGAAGLMTQLAMQQTMQEITDYLARIDEKIDDVLRGQQNSVVAQMIGVGFQIEEAMTIREHVGSVSDVTWSKIQDASGTIADTQAYALLQLDDAASKLEGKTKIADLAKTVDVSGAKVREWLAVLARCFQLLDGIAVLELDRVLATSPEDLDGHRLGLESARRARREAISLRTRQLLARMDAAAQLANAKVLLHPSTSPAVVQSSGKTVSVIGDFHELLGIEESPDMVAARRWQIAAAEARDKALANGAERVEAAKRVGVETRSRAKSAASQFSTRIGERSQRLRGSRGEAADRDSDVN